MSRRAAPRTPPKAPPKPSTAPPPKPSKAPWRPSRGGPASASACTPPSHSPAASAVWASDAGGGQDSSPAVSASFASSGVTQSSQVFSERHVFPPRAPITIASGGDDDWCLPPGCSKFEDLPPLLTAMPMPPSPSSASSSKRPSHEEQHDVISKRPHYKDGPDATMLPTQLNIGKPMPPLCPPPPHLLSQPSSLFVAAPAESAWTSAASAGYPAASAVPVPTASAQSDTFSSPDPGFCDEGTFFGPERPGY